MISKNLTYKLHHISHQIFANASMGSTAKSENFVFVISVWTVPSFRDKVFGFFKNVRITVCKEICIENSIACKQLFQKIEGQIYTGSPPLTLFFETLTKPCKQKTVLLEEWFIILKWESQQFQMHNKAYDKLWKNMIIEMALFLTLSIN